MECGMNLFECLDHNILNPKDCLLQQPNGVFLFQHVVCAVCELHSEDKYQMLMRISIFNIRAFI